MCMFCRTCCRGRDNLFTSMRPGYKIWLENDSVAFGDGLFELLTLIAQHGSISAAAAVMDMSYRAAWGKIKTFEKQWGTPLVLSQVGGKKGGGTVLTPYALKLVEGYRCFSRQVESAVLSSFEQCFKD